jgi:hypothetical protein
MSTHPVPFKSAPLPVRRPALQLLKSSRRQASVMALRVGFWSLGVVLAIWQAWIFRYQITTDSIAYLDMSDGVLPGSNWHRLIGGVWSPLYPFLIGLARRVFDFPAPNEIQYAHFLNVGLFLFAFACFEFFLRKAIGWSRQPEPAAEKQLHFIPLPLGHSFRSGIHYFCGLQLMRYRCAPCGQIC